MSLTSFDPKAHAVLGLVVAAFLAIELHRVAATPHARRVGPEMGIYSKFAMGVMALVATMLVSFLTLETVRFPVVVAVACLASGFARAYAAAYGWRVATHELEQAAGATWWWTTALGFIAGLVVLWMGWTMAWFILAVPTFTAIGYGSGAWVFAPRQTDTHCVLHETPADFWRSVFVWLCVSMGILAIVTAALLGGPSVTTGAVVVAGTVLLFAALLTWHHAGSIGPRGPRAAAWPLRGNH